MCKQEIKKKQREILWRTPGISIFEKSNFFETKLNTRPKKNNNAVLLRSLYHLSICSLVEVFIGILNNVVGVSSGLMVVYAIPVE
jgi:hypothetical protein